VEVVVVKVLKVSELRKMKVEELEERLAQVRAELVKLQGEAARGTIGKRSGEVKSVKRNIARILTVLNEKRRGKA
jgi:large subunit ribosomal protein L29